MAEPISRVRNIGIMAHIDAGKTTTTERILFYSGKTRRMGEVDDGDAEMDWMDLERERGITVTSAATFFTWRGHEISLVDTPGHVDFTAEVERSLRVLDGAVTVFCAVAGVQPQSEAVWRQAERNGVPRLVFVNKMDRPGARFDSVVAEIRSRLGANALPVQTPMVRDGRFRGVIDLVRGTSLTWDADSLGATIDESAVPPELEDELGRRRAELVEGLAAFDDALLADYLEGRAIPAPRIRSALRRSTVERRVFPVLCGAALRNMGIQPVLDAVVDYLPSPADVAPMEGVEAETGGRLMCVADAALPLVALAFKVATDPQLGRLTYLRVYSGRLGAGDRVHNATRSVEERVARVLRMHANRRQDVAEARAGSIVAVSGLRRTATGDTVCGSGQRVLLEPIRFPEPVVSLALEPKSRTDEGRLSEGMAALEDEDPTFRSRYDAETGEVVVSGMGELHLEVIVERLRREHGVGVSVGSPHVRYRESVSAVAEAEWRIEGAAGRRQYARAVLRVEPLATGSGVEFSSDLGPDRLPESLVGAVRAGVLQGAASGVLAGYPVVDVRAVLVDASWRDRDSTEEAFLAAGSIAFREATKRAAPVLLEPAVRVDVDVPEECLGDVVGQLSAKRALVEGVEAREGRMHVRAYVALREMLGYAREIRSASKGRGTYTMQLSGYRRAPAEVRDRVVGAARA